jgi:hypothetical protein
MVFFLDIYTQALWKHFATTSLLGREITYMLERRLVLIRAYVFGSVVMIAF